MDDDKKCEIWWPPKDATHLIKAQESPKSTWTKFKVQVLKFFDSFFHARQSVPKFCKDSQYETESEAPTGRGHRSKIPSRRNAIESSSDEEPSRYSKAKVPSPPPVKVSQALSPIAKVPQSSGAIKRRRRLVDMNDQSKKAKEKVQAKILEARAIASARMNIPTSPKITPGAGMTSPWKVSQFESDHSIDSPSQTVEEIVHTSSDKVCKNLFGNASLSKGIQGSSFSSRASHDEGNEDDMDSVLEALNDEQESDQQQGQKSKYDTASPVKSRKRKQSPLLLTAEERLEALEKLARRNDVALREISKKNDLILLHTTKLLKKVLPEERRISVPSDMPKLPLVDKKTLNCFEKFLKTSKTNEVAVMDYLSNYISSGVDAENKSVRSVLSEVLTNGLAENFNLDGGGKEGKESFRALRLYEVVRGTLISAFDNIEIPVMDSTIGLWLTNSIWRVGGSKFHLRNKSKKPASTSAGAA